MRTLGWSLLIAMVAAVSAVPAQATTTRTRDAATLARAVVADVTTLTGESLPVLPPAAGDGPSTAIVDGYGPAIAPREGPTAALLTNGVAPLPIEPGGTTRDGYDQNNTARGANDVTVLRLQLAAPETANCLAVQLNYLTQDFTFSSDTYSDAALVELDPAAAWSAPATPGGIAAPANIALSNGQPLSYASAAAGLGLNGVSVTANASGTGYAGGLGWVTATAPVTPGGHTVDISIFDRGDHVLDSAVIVDNLRFVRRTAGSCPTGVSAQLDVAAPAVALAAPTSPTTTSTPTLSGAAGTASGDDPTVRVAVYAGAAISGNPVQTLTVTASGTTWQAQTAALAPGTYTARAEQTDAAGNIGLSAPASFAVQALPAPRGAPDPGAQLGADLAAAGDGLGKVTLQKIVKLGALTVPGLTAPGPGTFVATLTGPAGGASGALAKTIVLASGRRTASAAGRYAVKLRLTKQGRAALRRAKRVRAKLTVAFRTTAGVTTSRNTTVRLRRR